jgi:hypothetical protein
MILFITTAVKTSNLKIFFSIETGYKIARQDARVKTAARRISYKYFPS